MRASRYQIKWNYSGLWNLDFNLFIYYIKMSGFDPNKLEGDRSKKKVRTGEGEEQPWGNNPTSLIGSLP